jgi:phage/plasmid-like protein (TIGR03299 family)
MPAEVNAEEFVYSRRYGTPWHGLGKSVEDLMTVGEAYELAGLDWAVRSVPLIAKTGAAGFDAELADVETHVANIRSDNGEIIGIVGKGYRPIQNVEQRDFIEALTGEGATIVDVCGALAGGRRVFWTLKVPGDLIVGGEDKIDKFLICANGHDGTLAFKAFWTPIRVVCSNTLNAAVDSRYGKTGVSLRHRVNVADHLDDARRILELTDAYYEDLGQKFERLMAAKVDDAVVENYFEKVIPDNPKAERNTRTENIRKQLAANYRLAPGAEQAQGTAYGAYNAVTFYVSHQRGAGEDDDAQAIQSRGERRFNSIAFGSGRAVQQTAFREALKIAG